MDTLNGGDSPRALFTSGLTPRWSRRPAQSILPPPTSGPPAAAEAQPVSSHGAAPCCVLYMLVIYYSPWTIH